MCHCVGSILGKDKMTDAEGDLFDINTEKSRNKPEFE